MPGGMVVAPVVMSLGLGFVSWLMSVYGKQSGTLCLAERVKVLTQSAPQIWFRVSCEVL
jgi:ABC-type thiamine transport system substrate-binding protein